MSVYIVNFSSLVILKVVILLFDSIWLEKPQKLSVFVSIDLRYTPRTIISR